ncbi:MAG: glycosyltransferase family 8 protein [Blautia sp.]|nr:glycosyltransferase family 8 protein [Blautia sp.]MCM1200764.1 glycosyltransferase family 8 protein [Bacteroides fragilis]
MEIPVVFATDMNYLFYTIVAITSMAENAEKNTFYHIYILASGELKKGHWLFTDAQGKYSNIKIDLLSIDESAFQKAHINNPHITKATFYRLLLGNILQVDKCLYLDSDIIVNEDLQELYTVEMNSAYIAGVRDLWIDLMDASVREQRRVRTNIPSMEQYINAGVLVFNLKEIRNRDLTEKFCSHIEIDYPYEDQDIINVCCYDHIRRLPAKWNLFTLFMGQIDELEKSGIDRDTIAQIKEKKGIIHYATPYIRPWESERFLCNDIWWKYAAIWSETPEYQRQKKIMRQHEIGYSENEMISYCAGYEKVYIWGFTAMGRKLFTNLLEEGVNIIGFLDNDTEKQKFTYCGKEVLPFDIGNYQPLKSAFIIAGQKSGKEVQRMLMNSGVREEDIVRYTYKDAIYYQCLRPEFCEEKSDD